MSWSNEDLSVLLDLLINHDPWGVHGTKGAKWKTIAEAMQWSEKTCRRKTEACLKMFEARLANSAAQTGGAIEAETDSELWPLDHW